MRRASAINVFPEYGHPPLWTDGSPYAAALADAGVSDDLFDQFERWNREWVEFASTELGDLEDWSDVREVQPWIERGRGLVEQLRRSVDPDLEVRHFDHRDGEWYVVELEGETVEFRLDATP